MKRKKRNERKDILMAIKSGNNEYRETLSDKHGDRRLFDFLSRLGQPDHIHLEQPSDTSIARHSAIPSTHESTRRAERRQGRVTFDSWAVGPAPALRDATAGQVRRFRFEAGTVGLEIVAERRQQGWSFVGRVYRNDDVSSEFILKAGSRKLNPESQGFYHWQSRTVPRRFQLISNQATIDFEEITWW